MDECVDEMDESIQKTSGSVRDDKKQLGLKTQAGQHPSSLWSSFQILLPLLCSTPLYSTHMGNNPSFGEPNVWREMEGEREDVRKKDRSGRWRERFIEENARNVCSA